MCAPLLFRLSVSGFCASLLLSGTVSQGEHENSNEGVEHMINRLSQRLECHPLAAIWTATSPSMTSPDHLRRHAQTATPYATNVDSAQARGLQERLTYSRGAARQILEEVLVTIGDVAMISHDLEMKSKCRRDFPWELGVGSKSPGQSGKDEQGMRHKLALIKNLDRVREELSKIRFESLK